MLLLSFEPEHVEKTTRFRFTHYKSNKTFKNFVTLVNALSVLHTSETNNDLNFEDVDDLLYYFNRWQMS